MFNDSNPTGISATFLKQDLKERGWTESMIKRWLKQPDDVRHRYGGGEYYIFHAKRVLRAEAKSDWQRERDRWRQRWEKAKTRLPQLVDVLVALWTLNRRAKRCRDMAAHFYDCRKHGLAGNARDEKEAIYRLKGQALHWLVEDGRLSHDGCHMFKSDDGQQLWSEVLAGEGYSFHRPCARPDQHLDGRRRVHGHDSFLALRRFPFDSQSCSSVR